MLKKPKFNNQRASFRGKVYHSKQERDDAIWLHSLFVSGRVKEVKEQYKIEIRVSGVHICNHFVDFLVTLPDGRQKYVETKGFPTEVWRLKRKLVEATSPIPYLVNPTERQLFS